MVFTSLIVGPRGLVSDDVALKWAEVSREGAIFLASFAISKADATG
jgi:hypothetical protein